MLHLSNECRSLLRKYCQSATSTWSFTDWHDHLCDILAIFSDAYDKIHKERKDYTRLSRKIYWAYIPLYWAFPEVDISGFITRNHNL